MVKLSFPFPDEGRIIPFGTYYRTNQIWQHRTLKCRSDIEEEKLVTRNFAVVKYQPAEFTDLTERSP